jgi:hypothetical protein
MTSDGSPRQIGAAGGVGVSDEEVRLKLLASLGAYQSELGEAEREVPTEVEASA